MQSLRIEVNLRQRFDMAKQTIVILHGWGLSKKKFTQLAIELEEKRYEVISLDFPGFGEEKAPSKPWVLDDYANFLHTYLQKEHIVSPILIGHSFGGRVSLRYNSLYNKSVRALILTGTPGFTPIARKKIVFFSFLAKLGKFIFLLPGLSTVGEWVRKWYYYVAGAKEYTKAQGSMRQTFKNVVQEPLIEDMKHVTVPTLLLWGEDDGIVPLTIAKRMQSVIKTSQLLIVPNSDHGVPYKFPQEFAVCVDEFVQKLQQDK